MNSFMALLWNRFWLSPSFCSTSEQRSRYAPRWGGGKCEGGSTGRPEWKERSFILYMCVFLDDCYCILIEQAKKVALFPGFPR